jgi:hypothetical protein
MRAWWLVVWAGVAAGCDDGGGGVPHEHDGGVTRETTPDAGLVVPELLSETGLYSDIAMRTLAPGVLEYEVDYELWSDGADKRRFLLLPAGTTIDTSSIDHWVFPIGTRVWKEFHRDGVHVETRFMEKQAEGETGWVRIAYVWNDFETDATAAPDGLDDARGTMHDVPSVNDCRQCHRGVTDNLIGVSALQIASPGGLLDRLTADGRLSDPPATRPAIPGDDVQRPALAYLHSNCGHCHNEIHPIGERRPMRLWVPVGLAQAEDAPVYATAIGQMAGHLIDGSNTIIVPGDPSTSQLWMRMNLRNLEQMPPLATELVDPTGSEAVRAWIASLPPS